MSDMRVISACMCPPSAALIQAVEEFNRGQWHDCHETLEELWIGSEGEIRAFYQGLLQIAVALYHWRNGNYKGAIILLESGVSHLRQVRSVCQQIEVETMRAATDRFREALAGLGSELMTEVDPDLIPLMKLAPDNVAGCPQGDSGEHF